MGDLPEVRAGHLLVRRLPGLIMKTPRIIELVLSAAFLIVFAMTLHSNWKLRQALADANAALHSKSDGPKAFGPGDRLPLVEARNAAGLLVPVARTDRESLLVVIDPACG